MSELESLKTEVIQKLDLVAYFEDAIGSRLGKRTSEGWHDRVPCIFHDDSRPSLAINTINGGFRCFACDAKGSIFDFHCRIKGFNPKTQFSNGLADLASVAGVEVGKFKAKPVESTQVKEIKERKKKPKLNMAKLEDSRSAPIPMDTVERFQANLKPQHFRFLNVVRGLTAATIKYDRIGWDPEAKFKDKDGEWRSGKYCFPVPGKDGLCRNIRKYHPDAAPETKVTNTKGFGSPARLLGLHEIYSQGWSHVVIVEGELDRSLLNQKFREANIGNVWGAVTGTAGAATFPEEWADELAGTEDKISVYFMFDTDEAGQTASSSHCTEIMLPLIKQEKFYSVKNIKLPLPGTKELKDVTDYFMKKDGSTSELLQIIEKTPPLEPGGANKDDASVKPIEVESLVSCVKDRRFIDKRVRVPLTISGQTSRTYHAAREFKVLTCPFAKQEGGCCRSNNKVVTINYGHDSFIQSCMMTKSLMNACLKSMACDREKPKCQIQITKKVVMEEYFAHQVVKRWRAEENESGRMENVQELSTIAVYILQPEDNMSISPSNYIATGWVRSHPNSQQATLFIESLEKLEDDWKEFILDVNAVEALNKFRDMKVTEVLDDLSDHVTKIYDSDDILLVVLLTFCCPLRIKFNNEIIRGWINSAIIGDSGTGKSATYQRLSDYMDVGDLFSILTGTRTGLLYSIQQRGGEWFVKIGRYVMSNEKIIAVDETQEATSEEIKKMAKAMDEGWLDISQVASGGYTTQTRTIFILNPKFGKTISDYRYGCESLAECFHPMFIRRLDIAAFATGKDTLEFYNKPNLSESEKAAGNISPSDLRSLIYWAWTRDVEDVVWTEEATQSCLKNATELSEKLGSSDDIPLVNPADFRNNLARLSVAYSILDCNHINDHRRVKVESRHVSSVSAFIEMVYSSASCNLSHHSKISSKKKTLSDYEKIKNNFEAIIGKRDTFNDRANSDLFCQLLLLLQQIRVIRKNDLRDQLSADRNWIRRYLAVLQAYNLIEMKSGGYSTTRKFNLFMQRWVTEPWEAWDGCGNKSITTIEEMLDGVYNKIGAEALKPKKDTSSANPFSQDDGVEYDVIEAEAIDDDFDPF